MKMAESRECARLRQARLRPYRPPRPAGLHRPACESRRCAAAPPCTWLLVLTECRLGACAAISLKCVQVTRSIRPNRLESGNGNSGSGGGPSAAQAGTTTQEEMSLSALSRAISLEI